MFGIRVMSLIEHFATLEDPRIERKKLHPLTDILTLCICAIVSGAEGWQATDFFAEPKRTTVNVKDLGKIEVVLPPRGGALLLLQH